MIRNKATNKSHIVYADITAQKPQNFRLEVTASLGVHLASFAKKGNRVTYLLTRQKRYRTMRSHESVFKNILGMKIHPNVLMAALFDGEIRRSGWKCMKDKSGFLLKCTHKSMVLTWKNRHRDQRTIVFESKKYRVQMLLKGFKGNVNINSDVFDIKKPENFS